MHRDDTDYEVGLFEADYTDKADCGKLFEETGNALSACVQRYLRGGKYAAKSEESLLKAASACNTLAAITKSRLLFWGYETRKDEAAFVLYNQGFSMEEAEAFYLLSTVAAGATVSLGVSRRFPDTTYLIASLPLS